MAIDSSLHSPRTSCLIALLAVLLGACTTAEDRLEQGVELERAGQSVGAAQRYVQALRKDPALAEARTRLTEVAPQALAFHLRQAERDRLRGDPVAAGQSMLAADALLATVRGVQVPLAVPADYAARRRAALDDAIAGLTRDAAAAREQARWAEALALYERVSAFDPSPAQAAVTRDARTRSLVDWANAEMAAGHFRAAMGLAERGLAEPVAGSGYAKVFESIRAAALDAGTIRVAFLPVSAPRADPRTRDFLVMLDDTLELDHWSQPVPFIEPVRPARVRRAAHGRHARNADARRAAAVARQVGAGLAVAPQLESYQIDERDVSEQTRPARTRRGEKVHYTLRTGTREYRAEVRYLIVGTDGRSRSSHTVSSTTETRFEEAHYPGNAGDLRLGPAERRAFDPDPSEKTAAEELAQSLGQQVREMLLAEVP